MEILSNHLLKLSGCYPEVSDRQNDAISLDRGFSDSLPVAIGTAIVLFCVHQGEGERERERETKTETFSNKRSWECGVRRRFGALASALTRVERKRLIQNQNVGY